MNEVSSNITFLADLYMAAVETQYCSFLSGNISDFPISTEMLVPLFVFSRRFIRQTRL